MLSDLIQYFTKTDDSSIDNQDMWDLTEYLEYVRDYTRNEDIKKAIENEVINHKDSFYEIFEYGFDENMYLNDMHLGDAIDTVYENTLVTTLLSTVIPTSSFDVRFEDIEIGWMLSCNNDEKDRYSLKEYNAYKIERKVDKIINNFILGELKDFADGDGYIDDYSAETMRVIVSHIKFLNKSQARKIRKAYAKDNDVRALFNELNFHMYNGELLIIEMYCIEEMGYNGFFDMSTVYCGLDSLRYKHFKTDFKNGDNEKFTKHLSKLNRVFESIGYQPDYHSSLFRKILKEHTCSKQEVIL